MTSKLNVDGAILHITITGITRKHNGGEENFF
jgi:hypothetical protein